MTFLNVRRSAAWLLLVATAACDGGPPAPPPATPAPEPEPAASRFLARIGQDDHPEAEPPETPVLPRFDFSGGKAYVFDFTQRVVNVMDAPSMAARAGSMTQRMTGEGLLVLKSKGDGTGTLLMKDMGVKTTLETKPGEPEKTTTMRAPTMAVPDVKEDGGMDGGAAQAQPLLKLLFPMPPTALKAGESAVVPLRIPFNAMGSLLTTRGTATIRLARFVSIDGRTCARLETEFDAAQLDIPKEVQGKHAFSVSGKAVHHYDPEAREFVSGEIAVLMKLRSESPMPKITPPEGAKGMSLPETMAISMIADNLLKLVRNPGKAEKEAGR